MITLLRNPPGMDAALLAGLDASFGGWGSQRDFDWCFRRPKNGRAADLIAIVEDGAVVAGSAVTYARLETPDGASIPLACMTGSWTLPAARGRGLFARVIEESRDIAAERGCALLIAFLAATNRSAHSLLGAGAHSMTTGYFTAPARNPPSTILEPAPAPPELVWSLRGEGTDAVRFGYTKAEWMAQFIERPSPVEVLQLMDGAVAVVERKGAFERVLELVAPPGRSTMAAWSQLRDLSAAHGRTLFAYSADAAISAMLVREGFVCTPGLITAFALGASTKSLLAPSGQTTGTWPFGPWRIANGDRM